MLRIRINKRTIVRIHQNGKQILDRNLNVDATNEQNHDLRKIDIGENKLSIVKAVSHEEKSNRQSNDHER